MSTYTRPSGAVKNDVFCNILPRFTTDSKIEDYGDMAIWTTSLTMCTVGQKWIKSGENWDSKNSVKFRIGQKQLLPKLSTVSKHSRISKFKSYSKRILDGSTVCADNNTILNYWIRYSKMAMSYNEMRKSLACEIFFERWHYANTQSFKNELLIKTYTNTYAFDDSFLTNIVRREKKIYQKSRKLWMKSLYSNECDSY